MGRNDIADTKMMLGYLQHLPRHLYNTKKYKQVHDVIDYSWMAMRRDQYSGGYDGFLGDIELALQSPVTNQEKWKSLQVRYALMKSSIRAIATKVTPELYPKMVKCGLWSVSEAISYAHNIVRLETRCMALFYLAEMPNINPKDKDEILLQILTSNWISYDEKMELYVLQTIAHSLSKTLISDAVQMIYQRKQIARFERMTILLPFLESRDREHILLELISDAGKIDKPNERITQMSKLAPYLGEASISSILDDIKKIKLSELDKRDILLSIVGFLPPQLHSKVLLLVENIENPIYKTEILVSLAEHKYLDVNALQSKYRIQSIPEYYDHPTIPDEMIQTELGMALEIVKNIGDSNIREKISCLTVLGVSSLSLVEYHELIIRWVEKEDKLDYEFYKVFSSRCSPEEKKRILEGLFEEAKKNYLDVLYYLSVIGPYLDSQSASRFLSIILEQVTKVKKFHQDEFLYISMGYLICQLDDQEQHYWIERAYAFFITIGDEEHIHASMNKLAQYSGDTEVFSKTEIYNVLGPEEFRKQSDEFLYRVKSNVMNSFSNVEVFHELLDIVHLLSVDQLLTLIEIFTDLETYAGDGYAHNYDAFFWSMSVKFIPPEFYAPLIDHLTRKGCYCYRSSIFDLMAFLPNPLVARLISKISVLENEQNRINSYLNLSPYFSIKFIETLVRGNELNALHNERELLEGIEEYRKKIMDFDKAIEFCQNIDSADFDYMLLSWLPYLSGTQLDKALQSGFRCIFNHIHWGPFPEAFPCLRVAPYLMYKDVLRVIGAIRNESFLRILVIQCLFSRLGNETEDVVSEIWPEVISIMGNSARPQFLDELTGISGSIGKVISLQSRQEIYEYIREVASWWA